MTVYNRFRKKHSEWPRFIRDVVGRCVRIKHRMETRGGTVFEKGEVLVVDGTYRGRLSLTDGGKWPNNRSITRVHPIEVELLRHESIVWRNREAFLLFCIAVAGKNGRQTQARIERFLASCVRDDGEEDYSPFLYIRNLINGKNLLEELKRHRFGQYTKLVRAFTEVATADLDLDRCRTRDLEKIHGIGPKTSRYFIMRTRPAAKVAALDTHILRWLREECGYTDVPKSTPQSTMAYYRVETLFLNEAKKRRMRPSRLDAEIWERYSRRGASSVERNRKDEVGAFG